MKNEGRKISVAVKPGARTEKVVAVGENQLTVYLSALAREGKANTALICALARYYHVAPSRLRILRGVRARRKIVELA